MEAVYRLPITCDCGCGGTPKSSISRFLPGHGLRKLVEANEHKPSLAEHSESAALWQPTWRGWEMNDRAIAGEFVTETFDYDGSRQVTVYVPPAVPEAVVFAGDGQRISQGRTPRGGTRTVLR